MLVKNSAGTVFPVAGYAFGSCYAYIEDDQCDLAAYESGKEAMCGTYRLPMD